MSKIPEPLIVEMCSQIVEVSRNWANDLGDYEGADAVNDMVYTMLDLDPALRGRFIEARDEGIEIAADNAGEDPETFEPCTLFLPNL